MDPEIIKASIFCYIKISETVIVITPMTTWLVLQSPVNQLLNCENRIMGYLQVALDVVHQNIDFFLGPHSLLPFMSFKRNISVIQIKELLHKILPSERNKTQQFLL